MGFSGGIGKRGNKGGQNMSSPYRLFDCYSGKPRPIRSPQGRNGEVKITKEALVVKGGPDGFIDDEAIAEIEQQIIEEDKRKLKEI